MNMRRKKPTGETHMRVELPYKVRIVGGPWGSPTYNPRTRETRNVTNRYFATMEDTVKFCGDGRRVKYAPAKRTLTVNTLPPQSKQ